MEKQLNGRRGFLKGFGLGGVMLGGALGGYHAATREVVALANSTSNTAGAGNGSNTALVPTTPDIGHLAPRDGVPTLMITGDNRPPEPPKPVTFTDNKYVISCTGPTPYMSVGSGRSICPPNELNTVSMGVGKDDRLWIKVGDSWKRVAVEG